MKTLVILLILVLLPFSVSVDAEDIGLFSDPLSPQHDTIYEYVIGIDTIQRWCVICDTVQVLNYMGASLPPTPVYYDSVACDSIPCFKYRDVWAPKVQVYLDSLQWQKLLGILEWDRIKLLEEER